MITQMENAHKKALEKYLQLQRTIDPDKRAKLLQDMQNIAHNVTEEKRAMTTGYVPYPSLDDPNFNDVLLQKQEFAQYRQTPSFTPSSCESGVFALSNAQKFLKNLISPLTPYNSIIIMHGTGVGKTCSAISIAESYKNVFNRPCLVIGPPSLRGGFLKQLSDPAKGSAQCTGATYGPNSNLAQHYEFVGYIAFASEIERLDMALSKQAFERKLIDLYSNRVIIVDEVQNLRKVQNKNKGVSHRLEQVLKLARNVKLVLLTATPLYNTVDELEFLMIMCYTNDKNWTAIERIRKQPFLQNLDKMTSSDHEILSNFARRYVSYMRGENPHTFPTRLHSLDATPPDALPVKDAHGALIEENRKLRFTPLILSEMSAIQEKLIKMGVVVSIGADTTDEIEEEEDTDEQKMLSWMTEASNIVYPHADEHIVGQVGSEGFKSCMRSSKQHNSTIFTYNDVLRRTRGEIFADDISLYSPKIASMLRYATRANGVVIIYSRYIQSGLLPIALALEHRGYNNFNGNLLSGGTRMKNTGFRYALIAGNVELSGNVDKIMNTVNSTDNIEGKLIKIVLISVKAAEGYDFRFVRELHVMEPWYNMSRIEQVVGRGVRNCSHALLPPEKRNCTIFLHAVSTRGRDLPPSQKSSARGRGGGLGIAQAPKGRDLPPESNDIYLYRVSELKQVQISKVERVLKENALDCHLNEHVLSYPQTAFSPIVMVDSQGQHRQVRQGDVDFTRVCDYMKCDFKCKRKPPDFEKIDTSTFETFFIEKDIELYTRIVTEMFSKDTSIPHTKLFQRVKQHIPNMDDRILSHALSAMLNKKTPIFHGPSKIAGYMVYRSDRYMFQPASVQDEKMTIQERTMIDTLMHQKVVGRTKVIAESTKIDKKVVMKRFLEKLKSTDGSTAYLDHVVDHLDQDELVVVAASSIADPNLSHVRDSFVRGHVIFIANDEHVIYNYYMGLIHRADGTPMSQFIAKRVELDHLARVKGLVGSRRVGFIAHKRGKAMFKVIVPKQKTENVLTGAVCTAFPQLKKDELIHMIGATTDHQTLKQASRPELCIKYELTLRTRGQLLRPVENLAAARGS